MNIRAKISQIYALEQLSAGSSPVHALSPLAKLLCALWFIGVVITFPLNSFARLAPLVFYPSVIASLSGTPQSMLFRRFLPALPFCAFAALSNVFWGSQPGLPVFLTVLLKTYLCVTALLLLLATTPLSKIAGSLRIIRIPIILCMVFEMTCRYSGCLFAQTANIITAYRLRGGKSITLRDAGSLAGHLLLSSTDRARRVFFAMECRGYKLSHNTGDFTGFKAADMVFGLCVLCFTLFFRCVKVF